MSNLRRVLGLASAMLMAMTLAPVTQAQTENTPTATPEVQRQVAMERLEFLIGDWEGVNVMRKPDGGEQRSRSLDTIRYRMSGELLTIEGQAFAPDAGPSDGPAIRNFGVFDYDADLGLYRVTSFVRGQRKYGTGQFDEDGKLEWTLGGAARMVRFRAWPENADGGQPGWVEEGDFSFDGGDSWTPAFTIHFRPAAIG